MNKIVLASGNAGKLREFQDLVGPLKLELEIISQSDFNLETPNETGLSFVENAILKARHAAKITNLPALADDSGLEVDALNGAPGIYSARFAGPSATDSDNNTKLLESLAKVKTSERSAKFHCLLVFMRHAQDSTPLIFQGSWEGYILDHANGKNGFGYDPLFFIPALNKTAAELPAAQKNKLSHRGQAMSAFLEHINSIYQSHY